MGIIALLAGILLPVVGRARRRADLTECAGRVRQIGIATNSYANDADDCLPFCVRLGTDPLSPLPTLPELLGPYVESVAAFQCPADRGEDSLFDEVGTSYEWNTFIGGKRIDHATMRIIGFEVSLPILGDAEAFHRPFGRNYLYSDGHVTQSFELLIVDE